VVSLVNNLRRYDYLTYLTSCFIYLMSKNLAFFEYNFFKYILAFNQQLMIQIVGINKNEGIFS